ncbi:hypothetical protein M8J76_002244 [Diaphorina citri]|nr:hypothetical protein M8J76_002244 [Diaphorina citri]
MEQNDTQFGGFGGPNSKRQPGIASGDYIEFSQEFDKEKDREKLKSIVKNFRRKYENVSEESLEDMCRPYFRARRSLRDITPRTNISEDHDEFFRRIDPFEVLDAKDFPTDLPPTLNHPEEIKRWMEEVLPTNSKEVPVNDTICHQMAMEELNNDLKRNISRPYAYYYKQARIDQVCEVEGAKFFERLSKTTTGMPTTTKSMRKMRDQLKGMFGTLDTHSLSRSSLEMPSYLIRGFRERFPEHCNDDGKSVDEKDFIFGNVFRYQKGEEIKRYELDNSADKITMVKKVNKNSENELYGCTQTLVDLGNKTMPKRKRRSLILEKRPKKSNVKSRKARNTNWKKGKDDSHFTDLERLDEKVINKKPDFVKDWDSRDKVYYRGENPHFKILKDDGTGDVPRFIREQCKEPSEEEDIIEGDRAVLKNFKEIDDYGVQSMPSQLKPDGGKSDRDHKDSVLEKFIEDVNKSSNTETTLDSNSFDYQFDDPARRYKLRVERLEKIIGSRVRTPGPDYFTMPPTTTELEAFQTKEINQITTKYTQWLTADSADVLEGNKEDLENFLNFQADQEIDKPWTEFDVEGMEKFLGKTLPNRNSSILYKLYRP